MTRLGELEDVTGDGVYLDPFEVVGVAPLRRIGIKERILWRRGFRAAVLTRTGAHPLTTATVEQVVARLVEINGRAA